MNVEQIRRILCRSGWTFYQRCTGRIQASKRGLDGKLMSVRVCVVGTMSLLDEGSLQQKLNARECRGS